MKGETWDWELHFSKFAHIVYVLTWDSNLKRKKSVVVENVDEEWVVVDYAAVFSQWFVSPRPMAL